MKKLLETLLIKLGLKKQKQYTIVVTEHELNVGKSVVTFLLNDGSSSSITLEGRLDSDLTRLEDRYKTKEVIESLVKSSKDLAEDFINDFNSLLEQTVVNISPTKMNQHFVRRSDIRRLTVVHSSHIIKTTTETKKEIK